MKRELSIRKAHPHLHVPRAAVSQAIALLDAQFKMLPGDLARLSLPRDRLRDLKSQISNLKSPAAVSVLPAGELSLVFLTDPALAQIHGEFMNDPTATDVITFEGDPTAGLAGEICVSADTAARYVGLHSVAALERSDNVATHSARGLKRRYTQPRLTRMQALQAAFAAELTLYVVHGWLHLAGYDDLKPAKKRRMRAAEARAMKLLQKAKAVPAFRLV